jgi:hypothetical protein
MLLIPQRATIVILSVLAGFVMLAAVLSAAGPTGPALHPQPGLSATDAVTP